MNKFIMLIKNNPIISSFIVGVTSISLAVTSIFLPGPQGEPGREIEFRVTNEAIEFRYDDETTYNTLINLDQLRGPIGENGRDVVIDMNETHVVWKYSDQTTWINLIPIETLKGMAGQDGVDGQSIIIDTTSTHIVWKYEDETTWTNLVDLNSLKGEDGREVEFQTSDTHIQWRYVGDDVWKDLLLLETLRGLPGINGADGTDGVDGTNGTDGVDGREVEFQTSDTHIQWRYVGDDAWTNLILLETLQGIQGLPGENGLDGTNGTDGREVEFQTSVTHIQWRYVGDDAWIDLIEISLISGQNGTDGIDGREVEFQTNDTHLQYRYIGDEIWLDLIELSTLKGDVGVSVTTISTSETSTNFHYLYENSALLESTLIEDDPGDDYDVAVLQMQEVVLPFNDNATLYYSGYGDAGQNNPTTGNSYGYEFYYIDGFTTTDLYFGIAYLDDSSFTDVEIRISYDIDFDLWYSDAFDNGSFLTNTFDEQHIVYVDSLVIFDHNRVMVPAGASNVLVEMITLQNINYDYDLGVYILDTDPTSFLQTLDYAYGATLVPGDYDFELVEVFNLFSRPDSYYVVLATEDAIIFEGEDTSSGNLEDLGIGTGTYAFTSSSDDDAPTTIVINGTLTTNILFYIVRTNSSSTGEVVIRDNVANIYVVASDSGFIRLTSTKYTVDFEMSDGSVISLPMDAFTVSNLNNDDFYRNFLEEINYTIELNQTFIPIRTADDFQNINDCNRCNYMLMNDIDLSAIEFQQILRFRGVLDGNHHTLTGLPTMPDSIQSGYGIFKFLDGAVIKNLVIEVTDFTATSNSGFIASEAYGNDTYFENIYIKGSNIDLSYDSGILIGIIDDTKIHVNGLHIDIGLGDNGITLNSTGFLFGYADLSTIYLTGVSIKTLNVSYTSDAGIFMREMNRSKLYLENIHTYNLRITMNLSFANGYHGGLVGELLDTDAFIHNLILNVDFNDDAVNANNLGGVFGYVEDSSVTFTDITLEEVSLPTANNHVGGLIGRAFDNTEVTIKNVTGFVYTRTANQAVGGLIGSAEHSFGTNSDFIYLEHINLNVTLETFDNVTTNNVGGLIGETTGVTLWMTDIRLHGLIQYQGNNIGGVIGATYAAYAGDVNNDYLRYGINASNIQIFLEIKALDPSNDGFENTGGFIGYYQGSPYNDDDNSYTFNGSSVLQTFVQLKQYYFNGEIYSNNVDHFGGVIGLLDGGNIDYEFIKIEGHIHSVNSDFGGAMIGKISSSNVDIRHSRSLGTLDGDDILGGFIGGILNNANVDVYYSRSELIYMTNNVGFVGDIYGYDDGTNDILISTSTIQATADIQNN